MRSIKRQLVISVLTIMCLATCIMVAVTYFELRHELDELFDENMKQVAHSIALHDFARNENFFSLPQEARETLKGEEEFLIQIWRNQSLLYSSLPALDFPIQNEDGVKTVLHSNQKWRYYAIAQGDWLVQVSQPVFVRHSVIWEIYFELLLPMLIQLPVLIIVIGFFITHGFAPLKLISKSIEQRNPAFLGKISEDEAPEEIRTMIKALNDLLERLGSALKAQRRFTADAAHELRTPLTAVSLQLDILRRAKTEKEKQEAIQELCKVVDRSTHLVRQLLDLARQEPDAAEVRVESCDLQNLLQDIFEEYEAMAKDKKISFEIIKMEKAVMKGDPHALRIMLGNLVSNAIAYTPANGKVKLSLAQAPNGVIFEVADSGVGISEQEKKRIFDRFYRIAGTKTVGSGLGLSIVKTIADRHNARISIGKGVGGAGTKFRLVFEQ